MSGSRPLHMAQPCGCGLYLHGHSWEYIIERGGADFVYCATHAAAPALRAALTELREACADAYKSGRVAAEPFVRAGNIIAKATA